MIGECGLTRYFKYAYDSNNRLFDYAANKQISSVYLKQIQNCFAFLPETGTKGESKVKLKQSKKTEKRLLKFKLKLLS